MPSLWDAIALCLILAPHSAPVPDDLAPDLLPALMRVAWVLDIAQPGNEPWGRCDVEVQWCRHHAISTRGQPPSSDVHRLPPRPEAQANADFGWAVACSLRQRLGWASWHEPTRAAAEEAEARAAVWTAIAEATDPRAWVIARRAALDRLRRLVGEEDYARAEWPDCVPLWTFRRADP